MHCRSPLLLYNVQIACETSQYKVDHWNGGHIKYKKPERKDCCLTTAPRISLQKLRKGDYVDSNKESSDTGACFKRTWTRYWKRWWLKFTWNPQRYTCPRNVTSPPLINIFGLLLPPETKTLLFPLRKMHACFTQTLAEKPCLNEWNNLVMYHWINL